MYLDENDDKFQELIIQTETSIILGTSTVVAIRLHQNDVSTFESICRGILPLWNLDFRITLRPLFKQPFIGYYILDNED